MTADLPHGSPLPTDRPPEAPLPPDRPPEGPLPPDRPPEGPLPPDRPPEGPPPTDRLLASPPTTTRSDARDNRASILAAARAVFAEEGLSAPMREVARHAGVGPATLYRHFPTKRDLIVETFAEQRRACHTVVREALADPDPWRGFQSVVERICELHARSRGFADAFMTAYPEAVDFAADRERTLHAVGELTRRAQRTGRLRAGFVVEDLVLMLMAHRGVQDAPRDARLAASRRFAAYVIEAFRAEPPAGGPSPLPPAPRLSPVP